MKSAMLTTQAVLMQHMDGFVEMASLQPLRPAHLLAAAEAIQTIHRLGWQHGDLHLHNILFHNVRNATVIIDWALARNWAGERRKTLDSCLLARDAITLDIFNLDRMRAGNKSSITRASALASARGSLGPAWALFDPPLLCENVPYWRTVRMRCVTHGCAARPNPIHDALHARRVGGCEELPAATCLPKCYGRKGYDKHRRTCVTV